MKSKKSLIIIALVLVISLLGITYAFFEYYGISSNQKIVSGEVTLTLTNGEDTISLINVFPESKEEARKTGRTDNIITFTVSGTNTTTNKDIYYEIMLNEGNEKSGKKRFNPDDLMFDLIEVNGSKETLLVDSMSYSDFNKQRIWVDKISYNTNTTKTYKLRMWLKENLLISDTDPNADYKASDFKNRYASVKVTVYGDFEEKRSPYNYLMYSPWSGDIDNQKANITEIQFVSMKQDEIDTKFEASTIKKDVTDTSKTYPGSVKAWLETDTTDTTKYIMYVASEGTTFFPSVCTNMFREYSSITSITFDNVNTKFVTNMTQMFISCSGLTSLDVSNWDTSNVTNMSRMFEKCSGLTSLDINDFDTSSATNMWRIFYACSALTRLELSNWDTSSVSNMSYMFYTCSGLTSLDVSNWDTSSVTNMSGMFSTCSGLTSLDVSNWDTSSVTNMSNMFYTCRVLTSLNLSNWDTSSVTNMSGMFSTCRGLTSLDLGNWNTSNVTNMSNMFYYCSGLTSLDIGTWNTSIVTNMSNMFFNCVGLISLNISNFTFDSVTSYNYIFYAMKSRTDNTPTIIVKSETEQNWILALTSSERPVSWTTDNVIVKS